jgi:hypothetical protein
MREGGLEGIETVVQRQERVAPERDDDGLLGREYRRARLLRAGALVLDRGALLPFGHRLRVDAVPLGQHPQARLTMLDRSTHRLCRAGAPMENLAHSASFHSRERSAPSNHGIKQLEHFRVRRTHILNWRCSSDIRRAESRRAGCRSSPRVHSEFLQLPSGAET